jgi:putative endonuclease
LVVAANVKTPFGEIDLVCRKDKEYVFVEVKTREDREYGYPEEAITATKFLHMARSAEAYLQEHALESVEWRLDVVAIRLAPNQDPEIFHFEAIQGPHGH